MTHSDLPATQARRLVFPGKQEVRLETFPRPDPAELLPGQVLVRTEFSLMSTGTENIVYNRLFEPGTHWDKWVKYPFYPGYTSVGTIEAAGADVLALHPPGQRVAYRAPHSSHAVEVGGVFPIPDELPFEEAVWFALAKIAFHGARAAQLELGDRVLVIGAGPIGQMALRWASAAGAETVTVVEPVPQRRDLALAGGASTVVQAPITEAREQILAANGGVLPNKVIDSTGNAAVFEAALGLAADFGTVVVLGDTGAPAQQHLTADVITRGIRIIGAHDGHNTPQWSGATISRLFFNLAVSGRFNLKNLNSHYFPPAQCADAYTLANTDRASTMGLVFDWRQP